MPSAAKAASAVCGAPVCAAALRQAVLEAAVQCYAVEGRYPESLDRLEREYGVQINHDRYIVTYDVFATNQLPDVQVLQKE